MVKTSKPFKCWNQFLLLSNHHPFPHAKLKRDVLLRYSLNHSPFSHSFMPRYNGIMPILHCKTTCGLENRVTCNTKFLANYPSIAMALCAIIITSSESLQKTDQKSLEVYSSLSHMLQLCDRSLAQ